MGLELRKTAFGNQVIQADVWGVNPGVVIV
jgi:hypothetical protein